MGKAPFVIIGSGISGMSLAIRLAQLGKVIIVTKTSLISGSTPLAQGGIAGVFNCSLDSKDSFQHHFDDTMKSGQYCNNPKAVKILVESAPIVLKDLQRWGITFHTDKHLEGGHCFPRIFHTGDTTGKTIAEGLSKQLQKYSRLGKIKIIENSIVTKISPFSCKKEKNPIYTADFYNTQEKKIFSLFSPFIFLATGGYSSLFKNATTPQENIGDGITVFVKAGGKVKNLGLIQFHPTVLDLPRTPQLLLSEALRGAGAKIINDKGKEVCNPLLPRDIVSQKIFDAQKSGEKIFLDCRNIKNFSENFPSIHQSLMQEFSLDARENLLPIAPAAHYCMGGIETDIWGRTNLKNIFALGECAHTGVHGKNRLASNSLLEGLVFSRQIFQYISQLSSLEDIHQKFSQKQFSQDLQKCKNTFIPPSFEDTILKKHIQKICSKYLGISRTKKGIEQGEKELKNIFSNKKGGTEIQNMKILVENIFEEQKKLFF